MDLKTFVSSTLTQIVEGLADAQKGVATHGAHINPGNLRALVSKTGEGAIWDERNNNFARIVAFDVALTVESGTGTGAKIGVATGIVNLSAGGASDNKQVAVSRVQFSIPVLFPPSDIEGLRERKATPLPPARGVV